MDEFWFVIDVFSRHFSRRISDVEDRVLSQVDFDYAFDEFKPINVKLLDDDPKKSQRNITRWSDIGGMEMIKQELIQTVQWRFEVCSPFLLSFIFNALSSSIAIIFLMHRFDWSPVCFSMVHRDVEKHFSHKH